MCVQLYSHRNSKPNYTTHEFRKPGPLIAQLLIALWVLFPKRVAKLQWLSLWDSNFCDDWGEGGPFQHWIPYLLQKAQNTFYSGCAHCLKPSLGICFRIIAHHLRGTAHLLILSRFKWTGFVKSKGVPYFDRFSGNPWFPGNRLNWF